MKSIYWLIGLTFGAACVIWPTFLVASIACAVLLGLFVFAVQPMLFPESHEANRRVQ